MNLSLISLRGALLSQSITGSQLETMLASGPNLAAWRALVQQRSSMRLIAASPGAVAIIKGSATATKALAASAIGMAEICAYPAAVTALNIQRQVFTTGGTWSLPGTTLLGLAVVCIGGGGAGGGSSSLNTGGGGGAGGAIVCRVLDVSTVTANVTVSVGSGGTGVSAASGGAGNPSSFGGFVTAAGGGGGALYANFTFYTNVALGGGAESSGRWWPLGGAYRADYNPQTAYWCSNANARGGRGGYAANMSIYGYEDPRIKGEDCLAADLTILGRGALAFAWATINPPAGTGLCAGGGSGVLGATVGNPGVAGVANSGCGGGGGFSNPSTAYAGGNGGSGLVVVYWIAA